MLRESVEERVKGRGKFGGKFGNGGRKWEER